MPTFARLLNLRPGICGVLLSLYIDGRLGFPVQNCLSNGLKGKMMGQNGIAQV